LDEAIAIVVVLGVVFANLVADLLCTIVNPGIRHEWGGFLPTREENRCGARIRM
jgi:hypothetical protein